MVSFTLDDWRPPVSVRLADGLEKEGLTKERLLTFPAFQQWEKTLKSSLEQQKFHDHAFSKEPYRLRSIEIKSIFQIKIPDREPKLLFATLEAVRELVAQTSSSRIL
jgi:hypothetical protein